MSRVFLGALAGGIVGGVGNVGLYFAGRAAVATYVPKDTTMFALLPWFHVFVISIVTGIGAATVFAALAKFFPARARQVLLGISVVVFLVH